MSDSPTVAVIEDHLLFRMGLRELLAQNGVTVVGEASTAELGIPLIREKTPDVAIVDLELPGMSGIEAIRTLDGTTDTSALVLTISDAADDVRDAMLAGACGYLLKDAPVEEIVAGVRAAADGRTMLSPAITGGLVRRLRELELRATPAVAVSLSPREVEVLRLVAQGKGNSEIAQELFISLYTVKNHISNILEKLGVENRIQAAVRAVGESLI